MVILSKRASDVNGVVAEATTQVDALAALDVNLGRIESEASSCNCDATCHCDDSDVNDDGEDATEGNVEDEFDDKGWRILVTCTDGHKFLAPGVYDTEDKDKWLATFDKSDNVISVEGVEESSNDEPAEEEPEPTIRMREDVSKELARLEYGGDYTKIPELSLQLALLRHLDYISEAVIEGRVRCIGHIGLIAASLERFCAQCLAGKDPDRNADGSLRWDSYEFTSALGGDLRDELEEHLNWWLELALKRTHPHLCE
jgi:hypothetical protein